MNNKIRTPTFVDFNQHLSPHFTLGEMLRSGRAILLRIDNVPSEKASPFESSYTEVVENMKALAMNVLEPLRQQVGRVIITSGFRCKQLNDAVGGTQLTLSICVARLLISISQRVRCWINTPEYCSKPTSINSS